MQTVPAYFTTILHSPPVDYEFYTVPQKNACLALKNQVKISLIERLFVLVITFKYVNFLEKLLAKRQRSRWLQQPQMHVFPEGP